MTAYAPSSACGHGCLPKPGTVPLVGWPVRVLRLAALVLVLLAGIAVALAQPALSLEGRARIKRAWFRGLLAASGVRLVMSGDTRLTADRETTVRETTVREATARDTTVRETTVRGTLVVANHVSWLDIPAVLAVEGMRVLAKSDVRAWPVLGPMAARGGTLMRSEERRVGKECAITCRSRWSPYH